MKRALFAALMLAAAFAGPAAAQDKVWHHAHTSIGEPKYPENFAHFDYVNPDAPKGGTVRLGDMGSFDTFNPILPQGEAVGGLGLVYETLLTPADDELTTAYGLLAESLSWPEDFSSVTFRLRPEAKWHDGEPVTAEDVVWSFDKEKELNPNIAQYYANVTKAEVTGEHEVTFTFDQTGNRELPGIVGQLQVLPKHWWEGTDANGKQRDLGASTLEPPMGSGPYELASFDAGRTVTYHRVEDYWGKNLPVNVGTNNFDEYRIEYFLDLDVEFEAFKADQFDWWSENKAQRWAQSYDFPAANDGRVVKELFPQAYNGSGLMVGFVPNLRKPMFQDERVRKALNLAFDFEELQKTLFFGQYERISSYFYDTELSAKGLPSGEELDILNSVKDLIPPSVFTEEYKNPVAGDPTKLRENLRMALGLLTEAGYTLDGSQLVDADGNQFSFEILLNGPTIEPVASAFATNLAQIGINAMLRSVDSAQYIERTRKFDYDVIYSGWGETLSPGNEQRFFWGSGSANEEGSQNYAGIADKGVDALIDKVIFADDRETLIAATKALDRVLLAHSYVVPSYTLRDARIARWDRFGHPETLPEYSIGFPTVWWWDETKAAAVAAK